MGLSTEREEEILNSFSKFNNWEERYREIIDWGKKMNPLNENDKKDELLVKGCQSKVWLHASKEDSGVIFQGDSDALITKGLLALMIYFYSGMSPQQIKDSPPHFITKLDLVSHLTPSRTNGLKSLLKQIQIYAEAFLILDETKLKTQI